MKISFIGTGLMGVPMIQKLIENKHQITVYNRTRKKATPLAKQGIQIARSSQEAIQASPCILLMLTDAKAVHDVLFKKTYPNIFRGRTIIQMGTIAPSESKILHKKIVKLKGNYLEAPVLGSIPQVQESRLQVMVGGTKKHFEKWLPIFKCFGPEPLFIGSVGKAASLKLALNQLIVSLTGSFALSLGFVQRSDIDAELFMKILRKSALYAPTFDKKFRLYLSHNYRNPNFPTKHLLKDVDLFLRESKNIKLDTRMLKALRGILAISVKNGLADMDYSSFFETIVCSKK